MTSSATLTISQLTRYIGAEVQDIDLAAPMDAATVGKLRQAWLDHSVLLFRNQKLEQEDLLRVTKYFGDLASLTRPAKHFPKGYTRLLPDIMMISNIRENGETIGALPDGEMHFHHDTIHVEMPDNGTLLYSLEVPTHGGDTLFASGYAAYETLDQALKDKLNGRRAVHAYNYGATARGGSGIGVGNQSEHPIFRRHEESGRMTVYANRLMTSHIMGMDRGESDSLLDQLFDHCENPNFVYRHKWRVGDLLVWDNRCSMHARDDFPPDQRRLMLRTTVKGTQRPV